MKYEWFENSKPPKWEIWGVALFSFFIVAFVPLIVAHVILSRSPDDGVSQICWIMTFLLCLLVFGIFLGVTNETYKPLEQVGISQEGIILKQRSARPIKLTWDRVLDIEPAINSRRNEQEMTFQHPESSTTLSVQMDERVAAAIKKAMSASEKAEVPEDMRFCPSCGTRNDGWDFCPQCGTGWE